MKRHNEGIDPRRFEPLRVSAEARACEYGSGADKQERLHSEERPGDKRSSTGDIGKHLGLVRRPDPTEHAEIKKLRNSACEFGVQQQQAAGDRYGENQRQTDNPSAILSAEKKRVESEPGRSERTDTKPGFHRKRQESEQWISLLR